MSEQLNLEMKRRRVALQDAEAEQQGSGTGRPRVRLAQTKPLELPGEAELGFTEWFDGAVYEPSASGHWDINLKGTEEHARLWYEASDKSWYPAGQHEHYLQNKLKGYGSHAELGPQLRFRGLAKPWPAKRERVALA